MSVDDGVRSQASVFLQPTIRALCDRYRKALLDDCVSFWFPRCIDRNHGGFVHCLDRDGTLLDSDKSVWAQGRMSWMLLQLYGTAQLHGDSRRDDWRTWAESGLQFLNAHCVDTDGRMFFQMTSDGRPIRKRRYAFSESFAAIAFAAHGGLTGNSSSSSRAVQLFKQFVDWNFTPGLMPSKFTEVRPMIGLGPRMIALVTAQEFRQSLGPHELIQFWIDRCIDEIENLFVKPELRCVMETVGPDGSIIDHFDGRTLNPGHSIECAWFILREGKYQNNRALIELGCRMLEWSWERGWDHEYGGLFYFRDVYGKPVQEYWHDMKFWWPHDEAIIATLFAFQLTGEPRYLDWHQQVSDWSFRHFADPEHGEWYGYLHRDGRVSVPLKGNLWKSFFHHPRALWSSWQLCEEMLAAGHRPDGILQGR